MPPAWVARGRTLGDDCHGDFMPVLYLMSLMSLMSVLYLMSLMSVTFHCSNKSLHIGAAETVIAYQWSTSMDYAMHVCLEHVYENLFA